MAVPSYLNGFVKDYTEKDFSEMTICSSSGNDTFEVWYYGNLFNVKGEPQPYIVDTDDAPVKIIAKDSITGEEILIFDGFRYGYNGMFCDEFDKEAIENRTLQRYEIPASKLILELGYGIDYDDEKEDYEFDSHGKVVLINGSKMTWEDVKQNGFDYMGLYFVDKNGKKVGLVSLELA